MLVGCFLFEEVVEVGGWGIVEFVLRVFLICFRNLLLVYSCDIFYIIILLKFEYCFDYWIVVVSFELDV